MSLTNVKDLDYMLFLQLDEESLLSFCSINKYYYTLYNNDFIWRQKILGYKIPEEIRAITLDKKYYFSLYKALKNPDFVKTIFVAICDQRIDILFILLREKNIDPEYMFTFSKRYSDNITKNYYYSENYNPNFPYFYYPVSLVIKSGNEKMWSVIKPYINNINTSHYILAIVGKSVRILEDLLKFGIAIDSSILYFSIDSYNIESTVLLLKHVDQNCINSFFNTLIDQNSRSYLNWVQNRNLAFEHFIADIKVRAHLRFYRNMGQFNVDFSNLLSYYTI